jgi:hypothetical protein
MTDSVRTSITSTLSPARMPVKALPLRRPPYTYTYSEVNFSALQQ